MHMYTSNSKAHVLFMCKLAVLINDQSFVAKLIHRDSLISNSCQHMQLDEPTEVTEIYI